MSVEKLNETIIPTEDEEALAFMEWVHTQKDIRDFIIHIPNEGKRSYAQGKRMVQKGLTKGVADYFIAIPRLNFAGLWIELKRRKLFRISDEQKIFLDRMRSKGYVTAIACGWEEAKQLVETYIHNPEALA